MYEKCIIKNNNSFFCTTQVFLKEINNYNFRLSNF